MKKSLNGEKQFLYSTPISPQLLKIYMNANGKSEEVEDPTIEEQMTETFDLLEPSTPLCIHYCVPGGGFSGARYAQEGTRYARGDGCSMDIAGTALSSVVLPDCLRQLVDGVCVPEQAERHILLYRKEVTFDVKEKYNQLLNASEFRVYQVKAIPLGAKSCCCF